VRTQLLHHLLVRSAATTPDATALVDGDRSLSYGTVDRWSNAIARVLVDNGVRPGDRVGLALEKSAESIAALYGVLKAGGVYVPFDPSSPGSRIAYIARDAGIRVVCTSAARLANLEEVRKAGAPITTAIVLDDRTSTSGGGVEVLDAGTVDAAGGAPFEVRRIAEDLAYILYTSGSTGNPKGVMLSHRAALAFVEWAVDTFRITSADRLSSHAPLHFDLSIFDLFAAAAAAAPVVLVPSATSRFPVEVRRFMERERITIWYSVPSVLSMLALRGGLDSAGPLALRLVLFAGEVFPTKHLRELMRLLPGVEYWNLYGPTETNVCTAYEVRELAAGSDDPIPIGRAIDGDETFVVDESGKLASPGDVGVLYVRGGTVMSGYWNDPDRTARTLAASPLHAPLPDLAFCTGDLVRERADGNYDFLGRRDLQIKSRGYRIELGEIETALQSHDSVIEAVVVAVPDEMVGSRLHAFAATRDRATDVMLIDACRSRLPAYMVPERVELLECLPKTSTGKVDRRALTELAQQHWTHATTRGK
jgi:amino acid adenylation domain-containing protein